MYVLLFLVRRGRDGLGCLGLSSLVLRMKKEDRSDVSLTKRISIYIRDNLNALRLFYCEVQWC